jgi:hypothetical protein
MPENPCQHRLLEPGGPLLDQKSARLEQAALTFVTFICKLL